MCGWFTQSWVTNKHVPKARKGPKKCKKQKMEKKKMSTIESKLKTQADCEAAGGTWNAAMSTCTLPHTNDLPKTDASLMRENERLKGQLETRENQLRQAIDIANRANTERKAKEEAEKEKLIQSIQMDGKFTKEELENKSLDELNIIRLTLDRSIEKTFASVAAEIDAANRRKEPLLTAGAWDSKKKEWIGGV